MGEARSLPWRGEGGYCEYSTQVGSTLHGDLLRLVVLGNIIHTLKNLLGINALAYSAAASVTNKKKVNTGKSYLNGRLSTVDLLLV